MAQTKADGGPRGAKRIGRAEGGQTSATDGESGQAPAPCKSGPCGGKGRTCARCAYSHWVGPGCAAVMIGAWLGRLLCANHPDSRGELREVGPGGTFLTCDHTVEHMRSEFFEPMLVPREERADADPQDHAHADILESARARAQEIIAASAPTPIDAELLERIQSEFGVTMPSV